MNEVPLAQPNPGPPGAKVASTMLTGPLQDPFATDSRPGYEKDYWYTHMPASRVTLSSEIVTKVGSLPL